MRLAIIAECACGWRSQAWFGANAEQNVIAELRAHQQASYPKIEVSQPGGDDAACAR